MIIKPPTISRRGFLRSLGVTATISVVAPQLILPEMKVISQNEWAKIVSGHIRRYQERKAEEKAMYLLLDRQIAAEWAKKSNVEWSSVPVVAPPRDSFIMDGVQYDFSQQVNAWVSSV